MYKNSVTSTRNIALYSDGTIRYDSMKYGSFVEAILADYMEFPTDDTLRFSISLCFQEEIDRENVFEKLKGILNKN